MIDDVTRRAPKAGKVRTVRGRARSAAVTPVRIGNHVSSAGGCLQALERAHALGCDGLQMFSCSPRQWRASPVAAETAAEFRRLRAEYQLAPVVIHDNYLINLAGGNADFHRASMAAFRGELERAVALGADYLVMHPGSRGGGSEAEAAARLIDSIRQCAEGMNWGGLQLLIENTAGGGGHLGGRFADVAQLLDALAPLPVAACIDTCHTWVAGYDIVSAAGYEETLAELEATIGLARVPVFHANDAKAARGSRLDRHEHIGKGFLGRSTFRRLLCDPRLAGKAFLLETPVDNEDDAAQDLRALRTLARTRAGIVIRGGRQH